MSKTQNQFKDFTNTIEPLTRTYETARVFEDFLTLSICALHQINLSTRLQEKDQHNEDVYFKTIERYEKQDLAIFSHLLGIVQSHVYHNPYGDLLGEYFTQYINRGQNGQFFTPESICTLMANINIADQNPTGKNVLDPACGSGRLLLAFAKIAPDNYFYANDVSMTCAKMTALNFMLNGLRGEVACMNALSMQWFCAWQINQPTLGIIPIEKEHSRIYNVPFPRLTPEFTCADDTEVIDPNAPQLTLF